MQQNLINPAEIKARAYLSQINGFQITNAAEKDNAVSLLKEVSDYSKALTAQRQELTRPLKEQAKAIEADFKKPLDFLKEADCIIRTKINAYLTAERRKAEAEAEAARKAAEEKALADALALEAEKGNTYDPITQAAVNEMIEEKQDALIDATAIRSSVNQSTATSTVRTVWTFEVVDLSAVPADFLMLNEKAVRQAIKDGAREIAGLKIFQTSQVAIK